MSKFTILLKQLTQTAFCLLILIMAILCLEKPQKKNEKKSKTYKVQAHHVASLRQCSRQAVNQMDGSGGSGASAWF